MGSGGGEGVKRKREKESEKIEREKSVNDQIKWAAKSAVERNSM